MEFNSTPYGYRKYLLDTSFLVSLWIPEDSLHEKAHELFQDISHEVLLIHPYVIHEVITVLAYKNKQKEIATFITFFQESQNINVLSLDIKNECSLYLKYNKKMSLIDIILTDLAKMYSYNLVTFDKQMLKLFKK